MSCLDKLKNAPGLSSIDKLTKQMVPSIIGILPTPQKVAIAAKNVAALTKNIAEQVAAEVNNTINAVTGKISATANAVKGIGTSLKSVEQKFFNSVKKISNTLNQQAKAVSEFLDCEINAMKENLTAGFEASDLQTNVTATATAAGNTLTNNQVKELAEDLTKKAEFIAAKTEEVKAKTVQNVATTPSNAQVNQKQQQAVNKLETATAPKEEDDIIYGIPKSVLESDKSWTRLTRYNWLASGIFSLNSRRKVLVNYGDAGRRSIQVIEEELNFLRESKDIYPQWPWQRKLLFDIYE